MTDEQVKRVLVITAHPDDVDFSCGATVAAWTRDGVDVSYCVVTDGDAGGFDPAVPRTAIGGIRRDEQRKAAAALGVTDVEFLGYPDGRLTVTHELRRDLTRAIRRARPDRVVTHSPERDLRGSVYASHPDHLATGEAALCAVYPDARNPFAHPELLADESLTEWTVPEVWIMCSNDRAGHYVDVTDEIDRKVAALREHASQTGHWTDLEERMTRWVRWQAEAAGLGPGRLAEGFQIIDAG